MLKILGFLNEGFLAFCALSVDSNISHQETSLVHLQRVFCSVTNTIITILTCHISGSTVSFVVLPVLEEG